MAKSSHANGADSPTFAALEPAGADPVDIAARYEADLRVRADGGSWLVMNMIASVDGAIAIDGVSGGLGGAPDRQVFSALRGLADAILVAAGTARAEGYGPPRMSERAGERRWARGQAPTPLVALVTRSLDLDPTTSLFVDAERRPVIYTTERSDPERRDALSDVADVIDAGDAQVDLAEVVRDLGDRDCRVVLGEGGPSLNAQLFADDLVDELCLSLSPLVVGGAGGRILRGAELPFRAHMSLDRVLCADDFLFLRYLRGPR
ncbi:MAG: pyrimidine reductase family protein [Acidimicrobiia bacterium]|nr:pyrimidine reductase family protein [Acidimicrobiia bacterium]